jgi:hypothetical protein
MSTTLGKRKRRAGDSTKVSCPKNTEEEIAFDQDAQEIFRRHFEAQFKPLPEIKKPVSVVEETEEQKVDEESDWNGISDDEDDVQVVEHTDAHARMAAMSKEQLKAFMVSLFLLQENLAHLIVEF